MGSQDKKSTAIFSGNTKKKKFLGDLTKKYPEKDATAVRDGTAKNPVSKGEGKSLSPSPGIRSGSNTPQSSIFENAPLKRKGSALKDVVLLKEPQRTEPQRTEPPLVRKEVSNKLRKQGSNDSTRVNRGGKNPNYEDKPISSPLYDPNYPRSQDHFTDDAFKTSFEVRNEQIRERQQSAERAAAQKKINFAPIEGQHATIQELRGRHGRGASDRRIGESSPRRESPTNDELTQIRLIKDGNLTLDQARRVTRPYAILSHLEKAVSAFTPAAKIISRMTGHATGGSVTSRSTLASKTSAASKPSATRMKMQAPEGNPSKARRIDC